MLDIIRDAIINHRQLVFDATGYHRIACPHILGTKNGSWHVLVWQINDDSEKGFKEGEQRWRCFDVNDISNLVAQNGEWERGWSAGKGKSSCIDIADTIIDPDHAAEVRSTSRTHIQRRAPVPGGRRR